MSQNNNRGNGRGSKGQSSSGNAGRGGRGRSSNNSTGSSRQPSSTTANVLPSGSRATAPSTGQNPPATSNQAIARASDSIHRTIAQHRQRGWAGPVFGRPSAAAPSAPSPPPVIPESEIAVIEFNGVPTSTPPYRDVPSILIATLMQPPIRGGEPNWASFLSYYQSGVPREAIANLQDFMILLTRVVIPNEVIRNRSLLGEMYTARPNLPVANRLRYDSWNAVDRPSVDSIQLQAPTPAQANTGRTNRPPLELTATANVPNRSIFTSRQTPDGAAFVNWLRTAGGPSQLTHRPSGLDFYLSVPETSIRTLNLGDLLRRTIRTLQFWWWLVNINAMLEQYRALQWAGVENQSYGQGGGAAGGAQN